MSAGWPDPKRGRHPHPGHPGDSAAESSEEVPFGGWPRPTTRERGRGGKALVAAAVLVLLVVFVIRNSHQVRVDFIVTSGHPRLIWLIVVCTLLGGAVGFFLGRPSSRSRRQRPGGPPGEDGEGPRRA